MHEVSSYIHRDLSGDRAKALTTEITQFHRSPGSSGYHAATNLVADWLRGYGFNDLTSTRYPLDGETPVGKGPLPLAWEPLGAVVRVLSPAPHEVVNMTTTSSCLAWWSVATPPGGVTAELVDVGKGESDADYAGKDVAGKIVLISHSVGGGSGSQGAWSHAAALAQKHGVSGILSDYIFYEVAPHRTRASLPNAVQLLRLPNSMGKHNIWACSITYPAAQRLRDLLRLGPVTLHAEIDAHMYKGEGHNLLATIPGRELSEESVFFIAHTSAATCPCANCAAGPALMVEIARTLKSLIDSGEVRRPRRSIKFLFIIEGSGSTAYIAANPDELARVKTAFCFDSVGHDQGKLKSVLLFYRNPDSLPSFINDYFQGVMDRAPKDGTWVFADRNDISPVQFTQAPYTPWSDNHTWAAYGVPAPLIMSWPDIYFHTQFLTADNTDPRVFRRCGIATALAAYEIADAGATEAVAIAHEVASRGSTRLMETASRAVQRVLDTHRALRATSDSKKIVNRAARELDYYAKRDAACVEAALSLVPGGATAEQRAEIQSLGSGLTALAKQSITRIQAVVNAIQGGTR